jgi:hypothetical protein
MRAGLGREKPGKCGKTIDFPSNPHKMCKEWNL